MQFAQLCYYLNKDYFFPRGWVFSFTVKNFSYAFQFIVYEVAALSRQDVSWIGNHEDWTIYVQFTQDIKLTETEFQ